MPIGKIILGKAIKNICFVIGCVFKYARFAFY